MITKDEIRQRFEALNRLPVGVRWDGDHYTGCHHSQGSFSNATIWNHMFSGFCQGFVEGMK
ncbi:hypothetical protein D3C85_802280 [compost metagenome]